MYGFFFDSQLWPPRQHARSAENAIPSSVLARVIRALAFLKADSSNKKFMCSNIDETNGVNSSQALHWTPNFAR